MGGAYAYDVTVEVSSKSPDVDWPTQAHFAIGEIVHGEYVLDPLTDTLIDAGAELRSLTVAGRHLDPTVRSVALLPGVYDVAAVSVDGVALGGTLTIPRLPEPLVLVETG